MPRTLHKTGLLAVLTATLLASCSHQERYGRDPKELRRGSDPGRQREVQEARTELAQDPTADDPEDISPVSVLLINGEPLTVEDVLKWIRFDLEELAKTQPADKYRAESTELISGEIRNRAESLLLYHVATKSIREQERERIEQFVDGRVREIINTEHGGRQTRYEKWLQERGIQPSEDRERIRRELIVIAYLQRTIGQKVAEPTRRELELYYKTYCDELAAAEKRAMRLIDVPIGEGAGGTNVTAEQARLTATRARQELLDGTNFAEVAKKYSQGINAHVGGEWGVVTRDGVRPRWKPAVDALYTLQHGAISQVIETDQACFVVQCADIERQQPKSFTELQTELIGRYKNRQFDLFTRQLVVELYEKAHFSPSNPGRFLRAVIEAAPRPALASRP